MKTYVVVLIRSALPYVFMKKEEKWFVDTPSYLEICFLFQHSGHTFKPIDNEYDEHVRKVMDDLGLLKRRHTELISLVQDVVRLSDYLQQNWKASHSSKIDILLSKKGLINWYMILIQS